MPGSRDLGCGAEGGDGEETEYVEVGFEREPVVFRAQRLGRHRLQFCLARIVTSAPASQSSHHPQFTAYAITTILITTTTVTVTVTTHPHPHPHPHPHHHHHHHIILTHLYILGLQVCFCRALRVTSSLLLYGQLIQL